LKGENIEVINLSSMTEHPAYAQSGEEYIIWIGMMAER